MSQHEITIEGGTSKRLLTAGKYCDRDILVTATGGASIETVPVTIVDGENLRDTIQVIYTTVDSSGETMLDCLEVRHTDFPTHTINVVKGTTIQIVDLTGDYKIGYDSYDGFESVYDYDGTALFCDVTDTPSCEITPSQIEITSGGSAPTLVTVVVDCYKSGINVTYTTYTGGGLATVSKTLTQGENHLACVDKTVIAIISDDPNNTVSSNYAGGKYGIGFSSSSGYAIYADSSLDADGMTGYDAFIDIS